MKYIFFALLAAVLYALNAPFSKLLLAELPPAAMAGLLYLGAGIGMAAVGLAGRLGGRKQTEKPLERTDFPYVLAMILLDIAAPILLMLGLSRTSAAAASLLNNFEIVATSLIALAVFREKLSPRLWAAIGLVTISCALLSAEDVILGGETLEFSAGSLFVLGACICWGIENNCTGKLSEKDPLQVVVVKGIFSGIGSLVTAWLTGETIPLTLSIIGALILGFVAYGLSIYFYVSAQRGLGAAKTSAYYAVAPFVGSGISLVLYREIPSIIFLGALAVMIAGTVLASEPERSPK
ncbi:MAG: DMT family transporter [Ruminococcaceae bacterium]|nr:DMT family transporter [Oscillospiraceae bacterium]